MTPRRVVTFGAVGDRWRMRVDVPIDEGMVVEKALVASRSQVFHDRHPDDAEDTTWRSSVDWGDGLARMAELALRALDGGLEANRRPADRFQVLLHLDLTGPTTRWHMGDVVPDAIRRYLSCDADIRAVIKTDGVLTAMSSRMRTVDDRLRAFVEHRDGGCVVPGCTQRRWLHIHHIHHWRRRWPHRVIEPVRVVSRAPPSLACRRARHRGRSGQRVWPHRSHRRWPRATEPFRHPIGERSDWRFFDWFDERGLHPN